MYPENGPIHLEYSITRNVMESAMELKMVGLFENFQKATSIWTALSESGLPQPPTPLETDNTSADIIVNGTDKQKIHSNRHDNLLGA